MFGIEDFDPVINPPQAAILGVGAAAPEDGRRPRASCASRSAATTASSPASEGAEFLATVRPDLEEVGP